jgi:hypothetical protein
MTLPTPFPLARYRFDCVVETPLHLPEYAGSTLRGAFGRALRRTACMTRQAECKPCPLYRSCPYPAIFSPPPPPEHPLQKFSETPVPFVVEPPDWGERDYAPGDTLQFHFVLCGRPLEHLPLVIHAWQRALAHGIGRGDGTARLARVCLLDGDGETSVFDAAVGRLIPHHPVLPEAEDTPPGETLSLRILTPLRIQHEGRPLRPDALTPRAFLMALVRRVALISEFHMGRPLALDFHDLGQRAAGIRSEKALQWRDWTRYSSRQKQEMVLGGCIGTWTLHGDLAPFFPFLHAGRWLHAGKNASFGLGRYTLAI